MQKYKNLPTGHYNEGETISESPCLDFLKDGFSGRMIIHISGLERLLAETLVAMESMNEVPKELKEAYRKICWYFDCHDYLNIQELLKQDDTTS